MTVKKSIATMRATDATSASVLSEAMLGAEIEALLELVNEPWEVWTGDRCGHIVDMVLRTVVARGFATLERLNSTLHRFTITSEGVAALTNDGIHNLS